MGQQQLQSRRRRRTANQITRGIARAALAALAAAGVAPAVSAGTVRIVDQSAKLDRAADSAHFSLTFDARPDFSAGPGGVPVNSFQYEVDATWTGRSNDRPLDVLTSVVRGDEIAAAGGLLRVRSTDLTHPDPNPAAGGWGLVLGAVPYRLAGHTLTFDAPLALLGDAGDGVFAYRVFAVNAGQNAGLIEGHVIPLPAGALTGGAGMAALAAVEAVRRRRARAGLAHA